MVNRAHAKDSGIFAKRQLLNDCQSLRQGIASDYCGLLTAEQ